jgi:hypothetical protein
MTMFIPCNIFGNSEDYAAAGFHDPEGAGDNSKKSKRGKG